MGSGVWVVDSGHPKMWRPEPATTVWYRDIGGTHVNLAVAPGTCRRRVRDSVAGLRRFRVGSEARFPDITVWLHRPSLDTLRTLAELDSTSPRMRVMLVAEASPNEFELAKQPYREAINSSLDARILLVSGTSGSTVEEALGRARAGWQAARPVCEWYPLAPVGVGNQLLTYLLDLGRLGYSFVDHPLDLCGGVAHFVRSTYLARLGAKATATAPPAPAKDTWGLRVPDPCCSLGAIQYVTGQAEWTTRLRCACTTELPSSAVFSSVSGYLDEALAKVDDRVLFEDWHYIHDRFSEV